MSQTADPAVAEPADDNRMPGMGRLAGGMVLPVLAGAARFVLRGHRPGVTLLSHRGDTTFRAWLPVYQTCLMLVVVGGVCVAGFELEPARAAGAVLVAVGLAGLVGGLVAAAALEEALPAPHRPRPPRVGDPFRPHDADVPLTPLADGVAVAQQSLRFMGMRMGTRTTVLDTGSGLIVVSPVDPDEALLDAVRAMGTVRWIVAPNALHHLWVAPWHTAFPDAELWAAPGLAERRPDLPWTGTLTGDGPVPWDRQVVDLAVFHGNALVEEVVLMHQPTGTLVVTDLIQDHGQDPGVLTASQAAVARLARMWQRPGTPPDLKFTVSDLAAFREAKHTVDRWGLERIVIAHGPLVRDDAEGVWRDALAWVA